MDLSVVEWLNSGVGRFAPWDAFMEAMVSDYLVPALSSLVLIALWFLGEPSERYKNQLTTICGIAGLGLANLGVALVNIHFFRDRPFVSHDLNVLFYEPTDSSFPANAAAVGFAVATAVFMRHRRLGLAMYGLAFLWAFGRVYAGVHYPTDILGGAAIGAAGTFLAYAGLRILSFVPRLVLRGARTFYLA